MTKDIIIGQRLHEVMNLYSDGMKDSVNGYLKMGKAIHLLKKNKLWQRDCAGVPSFKCYVENELKISIAQAHRLEQIYREVGEILEKRALYMDISTVTLLLPLLKDKEDTQKIELLEMNEGLPIEAVKNNILEMTGNGHKATDICNHEYDFEVYHRCTNCGKFLRIE